MLAVRRTHLATARSFGLVIPGIAVACVALYLDDTSSTGCGWATRLLYLAAGVVLAALPVRLPGSTISLLPAVLLPAWLSCGMPISGLVAASAILLATIILRPGILPTALGVAGAVAGVFVGDLLAWGVSSIGGRPDMIPESF